MRTKKEVSDEKLRGGFYSPAPLVQLCLKRANDLTAKQNDKLRVLEPSAGDGAFIRGISQSPFANRVNDITAIELIPTEADKARAALSESGLSGVVATGNFLEWGETNKEKYDIMLANPPYVRFQFISDGDKQRAKTILTQNGISSSSVANLWISVLLLGLSKLRTGGVFSVILPTEFLTGISASSIRNWLVANAENLHIDLFKPGSFPNVLQEVLVLTGQISDTSAASRFVKFSDHNGSVREWEHVVNVGGGTWTNFLLTPKQNQAYVEAQQHSGTRKLHEIAKFSVSTVTGANNFFCVSEDTVAENDLDDWVLPLLSRTRYADGLIFTQRDYANLKASGVPSSLLNFSSVNPDPMEFPIAKKYLESGVQLGIDARYKCRIRTPWYRVPVVAPGELLLSKRSNKFPRVISNHANVYTTDTIYRGVLLPGSPVTADDFAATFHNSLTLLSAEIEGRNFGGGVLELVPSEVSSLILPITQGAGKHLPELDKLYREIGDSDEFIEATNKVVSELSPALDSEMLWTLHEARQDLNKRRITRTHAKFFDL